MKTIELTRKELYDIVWSTPVSKLNQQYALSNEGIKKICKKFEFGIRGEFKKSLNEYKK